MVLNVMFVILNGCFMTPFGTSKKADYRCDDNLNDGRIKHPFWSVQATPGQLCRFSHFPWCSLSFFDLQEGNPDVVIAAILISVSDRGKERCRDNKVSLLTKMH